MTTNATKPMSCCTDFDPPNKLEDAHPEFPKSDVGHSGVPILEIVIEPDGTVDEVAFLRRPVFKPPWPETEEAITEGLRKWRYEPSVVDGNINWS